jgi:hypothetical protein
LLRVSGLGERREEDCDDQDSDPARGSGP